MKRILIVDDDAHIGDMLEETLVREGYAVTRAYSGTEALLQLKQARPDLVLLDLMLPGLSGEEVLAKLEGVPVIVVSAKLDVQELLARIAVQLRKNSASSGNALLSFGELTLDPASLCASVNGHPVKLTRTECAILKLLMVNPRQVITRSVLLDRISLDTPDCTERSLKQHVSNLRRKLMDAGGPDCIETVWGIGFKLREMKS